jgi:hypothetical protein
MAARTVVLAFAFLACLGACQSLRPAKQPLVAFLRTDSAEIGVRHTGIAYGADIGFVYTNATSGPVSRVGCGGPTFPALEKKVNDKWVYAYYPIYLMCLTKPDFKLESGQSFRGVLQFGAFEPGHNTGPELRVDSIDGVYRLRWDFVEGIDASVKDARRVESTSNEFRMILRDQ